MKKIIAIVLLAVLGVLGLAAGAAGNPHHGQTKVTRLLAQEAGQYVYVYCANGGGSHPYPGAATAQQRGICGLPYHGKYRDAYRRGYRLHTAINDILQHRYVDNHVANMSWF